MPDALGDLNATKRGFSQHESYAHFDNLQLLEVDALLGRMGTWQIPDGTSFVLRWPSA